MHACQQLKSRQETGTNKLPDGTNSRCSLSTRWSVACVRAIECKCLVSLCLWRCQFTTCFRMFVQVLNILPRAVFGTGHVTMVCCAITYYVHTTNTKQRTPYTSSRYTSCESPPIGLLNVPKTSSSTSLRAGFCGCTEEEAPSRRPLEAIPCSGARAAGTIVILSSGCYCCWNFCGVSLTWLHSQQGTVAPPLGRLWRKDTYFASRFTHKQWVVLRRASGISCWLLFHGTSIFASRNFYLWSALYREVFLLQCFVLGGSPYCSVLYWEVFLL